MPKVQSTFCGFIVCLSAALRVFRVTILIRYYDHFTQVLAPFYRLTIL